MTPDGLTVLTSQTGPKQTMDALARAVVARGMTILARIDHAAAAAGVGMTLRPTEVLIFGNPRAGTPLMQSAPTLGVDLPLRALVWRDDDGATRLAYANPDWLAARHGVAAGHEAILAAMTYALVTIAAEASGG